MRWNIFSRPDRVHMLTKVA